MKAPRSNPSIQAKKEWIASSQVLLAMTLMVLCRSYHRVVSRIDRHTAEKSFVEAGRAKTDFTQWIQQIDPTGKSRKSLSSPSCKNILIFRNRKSDYIPRHPVPLGGALRERHERGDGLWWAVAARDAKADGQVVWF
jgi:hypothetical protein